MHMKCLPFVHEFVCENDIFICSGDLLAEDVDDVFGAVLLFVFDMILQFSIVSIVTMLTTILRLSIIYT